eukprot:13173023-Alexandrium_andersonii.AAC.1
MSGVGRVVRRYACRGGLARRLRPRLRETGLGWGWGGPWLPSGGLGQTAWAPGVGKSGFSEFRVL